MKETICNAVYTAIKNDEDAKKVTTSWKNLGFIDFNDMLNQIKTDIQAALWVLDEFSGFSCWENNFMIDIMDDYGTPVYQVEDFTFEILLYDEYKIRPLKKVTKTFTQTFWEEDNNIKHNLC